jgi:hypothetical protein
MVDELDAQKGDNQCCAHTRDQTDEAENYVVPTLRERVPVVNRLKGRTQDGDTHKQDHR